MAKNITTVLEKLNLVDRFLFDETMESQNAYQAVVSILLENEIELAGKPETEKELRVSPDLRQVRLDVVGMDYAGTVYYTEMQKVDTGNLRKRSRFYQAHMDVSLLPPGSVDFNTLNDSCFIMIAPFDIFGKGLYRYTFEGTCRECPELKLEDGSVRIFINARGNNPEDFSQEFLDFMEYILDTTDANATKTDSAKIKQIHEQVKSIRLSEKMGMKYMQAWEERILDRQEARREGLEEGREEGIREGRREGLQEGHKEGLQKGLEEGSLDAKRKIALNMLKSGIPEADVARMAELSLEEVGGLRKKECNNP